MSSQEQVDLDAEHSGKHYSEKEEHMSFRNYMRDVILGTNDGLVSVFSLVLGVAGGGFTPQGVLVAGIAAAVAGAVSMALGEYLSTKSQDQVYESERKIEQNHIKYHKQHEVDELYKFYKDKGLEGDLLDQVVDQIASDDEVLLDEMMMTEFGILDVKRRVPIRATLIIGLAFIIGSLPSVIPFIFVTSTMQGIIISSITSVTALFIVGALKAYFVKSNIYYSGFENMFLGMIGAAITYGIGYVIGINV